MLQAGTSRQSCLHRKIIYIDVLEWEPGLVPEITIKLCWQPSTFLPANMHITVQIERATVGLDVLTLSKWQRKRERAKEAERMLIFEFGNAHKSIFFRKMSAKSSRIWATMSGTWILAQFHNRTRMSQRKWQAPFANIPHKLTRQISWKMRMKIQSSEH